MYSKFRIYYYFCLNILRFINAHLIDNDSYQKQTFSFHQSTNTIRKVKHSILQLQHIVDALSEEGVLVGLRHLQEQLELLSHLTGLSVHYEGVALRRERGRQSLRNETSLRTAEVLQKEASLNLVHFFEQSAQR